MNILLESYQKLQAESPRLRTVEAAEKLGVSEAELLNALVGVNVTSLDPTKIPDILKTLKKLGQVMALTRNDDVVNEIKGVYEKLYISERNDSLMGVAINPGGIDLRLFLHKWHSAFLVESERHSSVQFFDAAGKAVHKVFTTIESDLAEMVNLKERFKVPAYKLEVLPANNTTKLPHEPSEQELTAFRSAWAELEDVHHFPKLLETFNLNRVQALELVGTPWSYEIPSNVLPDVLETVKNHEQEIMVFVGNQGAVQIYSGLVQQLKQVGEWFNVLDPMFNLHAKAQRFDRAFVVKKPTDNGDTIVTSIEFFNAQGDTVLTLFGRRTEGKKQTDTWQSICHNLTETKMLKIG